MPFLTAAEYRMPKTGHQTSHQKYKTFWGNRQKNKFLTHFKHLKQTFLCQLHGSISHDRTRTCTNVKKHIKILRIFCTFKADRTFHKFHLKEKMIFLKPMYEKNQTSECFQKIK